MVASRWLLRRSTTGRFHQWHVILYFDIQNLIFNQLSAEDLSKKLLTILIYFHGLATAYFFASCCVASFLNLFNLGICFFGSFSSFLSVWVLLQSPIIVVLSWNNNPLCSHCFAIPELLNHYLKLLAHVACSTLKTIFPCIFTNRFQFFKHHESWFILIVVSFCIS